MREEPTTNISMKKSTDIRRRRTFQSIDIFRSFNYPVYRIFFFSTLNHNACVNMQVVVRSLLVYRLTGSAAILGAMSFAHLLPLLFMSLFGGAIADRAQKKLIIIIGESVSALVALGVGLSLTVGYLTAEHGSSLWVLVFSSVMQGTVMGLTRPSHQSIIPEIVREEDLMNSVSLNAMSMNVMRFLAPAAAGFLIDIVGFSAVYYTMAFLYFMAAVIASFLPHSSNTSRRRSALAEIKKGLGYIRSDTNILLILVIALIGVVLSMPYVMLLPIFADDILKVGATGLGTLMSISGVGAITGSLVLATLPNKKRGLMLLFCSLAVGLTLTAFSFSSQWHLSLGLIGLVGLTSTARMALISTLLQYYARKEYRGRVMSIFLMEFGLMSFGTFAAGLLTEAVGVQWALGSFSLILTLLSLIALLFLSRIRNLE